MGPIMYPGSAEMWINVVHSFITYLWSTDLFPKSVSSKQGRLTAIAANYNMNMIYVDKEERITKSYSISRRTWK
jgi:hypothetical protein